MSPKNHNLKIAEHNLKDFKDTDMETHVELELQMVLDAFPFYVMLLDADHKILLANKAIRGDLGFVPEQIVGEYCPKVVHGLEEPYPGCPLEEAIEKGHGVEREFFDPDSNRWVNSAIYQTKKYTQDGKEIFIHFISDISQKKQAEVEIERSLEIQTVISRVLSLSLEDIPLDQVLKQALELILSISWLALDSKGSIFLVKEKSEVLVMKAQHGLSKEVQMKCARISIGKCLCGQAALTKGIQFADCIDDRHQILYSGIRSHGHYCVPILFEDKTLGVINLYLKEGHRQNQKEEEFLKAVSNTLAGVIIRNQNDHKLKKREEELEINNRNLEEMNSALNVLLKKRDEDRQKLEENVLFNAKKLLAPYIDELKNSKINYRQARFVNILESNLNKMISPFAHTLSHKNVNLTPLEIQIADLIKQGKSTKEIAEIFSLSIRTIEFHRQNLRKKLGLKHKKSNLRTYLLSIE
jgi:PAS domain S-box-containing protein